MASKVVSIKQKTTWIIFLVSMVVLLLSSLLFAFVQVKHIQDQMRGDLESLADILTANSSRPLAIKDIPEAEELISSLEAIPHVVNAYLYLPDGYTVAAYFRPANFGKRLNARQDLAMLKLEERQIEEGLRAGVKIFWQEEKYLSIFQPVNYSGSHVGYLYLRTEMTALYAQLLYFALGWLIVFGVAVVLSYLLSLRLQQLISKPVDQLMEQMQRVATEKKLSGVIEKPTLDEFGMLYRGFDEMLKALQDRDRMLEANRQNLEREVRERTAELVEAKLAAEKATEAKSRFLANMSHEIRTPMIGVLGMADLLRQTNLSEKDRRLADTVYHSGEALLNILNDILDFSKIEAGRLELTSVPFDLKRSMADIIELLDVKAREKGLRLVCDLPDDLPAVVNGDPGRLRQVLLNLIGNAIKFTEQGEVKVSLAVAGMTEQGQHLYQFQVQDTGIGIPGEDLGKIFNPFDQGDRTSVHHPGGTGLGLAIVRDLAELMGGKVTVQSRAGEGSTFTLVLPFATVDLASQKHPSGVAPQALTEASAAPVSKSGKNDAFDVSGKRVLLAEDNVTTQELLTILLDATGVDLAIVLNGREALDYLASHEVDLVFMDCQMPEMDGFEATRQLRQQGFRTPIIALTAYARSEDHQRCLEAGMDDFLCKPFRQQDLKNILGKWLSKGTLSQSDRRLDNHRDEITP